MKKRKLHSKEQDELQRYKRENEKLKRTVQSLRKQLDRLDIDQYQNLKEIIESQENYESKLDQEIKLDKLKKKWECNTCGRDYLRLVLIPRLDGLFYIRRCKTCLYKTSIKKYTNGVEGIEDNDTIHPKPVE